MVFNIFFSHLTLRNITAFVNEGSKSLSSSFEFEFELARHDKKIFALIFVE